MSIDSRYSSFFTKPEDSQSSFELPSNFDFNEYYRLRLEEVSNGVTPKGKEYFKIVWKFFNEEKFGSGKIYDFYPMGAKWKLAGFENLYRNWGLVTKCHDVVGKVVDAKLKKESYIKDGEKKEALKIDDIKQWHYELKHPEMQSNFQDDDIPF